MLSVMNMEVNMINDNLFVNIKLKSIFVIIFAFVLINIFLLTQINLDSSIRNLISLVLFYGVLFAWVIISFKKNNIKIQEIIGEIPKDYNWWNILGIGIVIVLFSAGSNTIIYYVISVILPSLYDEFVNFESDNYLAISENYIFIFDRIIKTFAAPFIEEIIFRGIILYKLVFRMDIKKAIFIVSIIFGLLHLNFLFGFFLSIVLSIIYLQTKTLSIPIAIHMFNNAVVSIVLIIERIYSANNNPAYLTPSELKSFLGLGSLIFVISSLWIIYFMIKNWPKIADLN
jgi:uncharacterized protein